FIQPIARIEIHPATALVRVGDSQKFEIVAYAADGRAIEGASAIFSSSNPAIVKLDASGRASGVASGTATIQAVLAGTSAQATPIVNCLAAAAVAPRPGSREFQKRGLGLPPLPPGEGRSEGETEGRSPRLDSHTIRP